jgi:hypothetical protein
MSKNNRNLKVGVSAFYGSFVGVSVYQAVSGTAGTILGIKAVPTALATGALYGLAMYGALEVGEELGEYVSEKMAERRAEKLFKQFKKTSNTHADATV